MDLKAELEKAKEAAWVAKAAAEASEQRSYDPSIQEIEAHLMEELARVCREYWQEVWAKALNLAGVPIASDWRRAENIYYPEGCTKDSRAVAEGKGIVPGTSRISGW